MAAAKVLDFDAPFPSVVERIRVLAEQGDLDDMVRCEPFNPARLRDLMTGLVLRCADGQDDPHAGLYYGP